MTGTNKIKHIGHSLYSWLLVFCTGVFVVISCSKGPIRETGGDQGNPGNPPDYGHGIFIVNEGNYNWSNASISYIRSNSDSVNQDIFRQANNRALGDVAQSMKIFGNRGFIVVDNSNLLEVVSLKDFKEIKAITGFSAPRYIEFVDSTKAYVTNMLNNISVVDLNKLVISKTIKLPFWTEGLIKYDQYMFITCIGQFSATTAERKARVYIVDTKTDMITDSLTMGKEPVSIVMDRKNKIWVLCTGGYDSFEQPTLRRIDPALKIVEKTFTFPAQQIIPSRLCINSTGDTLYYLYGGVFRMTVTASELPATALIPANGHLFYGLDIDPVTGHIFVSDAVDYVQNGWVFECSSSSGTLLHTYQAGRIPGSFAFTSSR